MDKEPFIRHEIATSVSTPIAIRPLSIHYRTSGKPRPYELLEFAIRGGAVQIAIRAQNKRRKEA